MAIYETLRQFNHRTRTGQIVMLLELVQAAKQQLLLTERLPNGSYHSTLLGTDLVAAHDAYNVAFARRIHQPQQTPLFS